MKKLIVLILCLTACRTADAQSVRFFATADDYLNGRFDTLPRSSLKVRRPFIAIRKTRIPKGELRHRLRAMGPNLLVVGDSVYSNLTTVGVGKPSKRFRQVQRFGDRIFFLTWTKSQYMNAMLAGYMFGIIGNTLSSGLARPYCCYWNLQTGEFRLLDSGCLYDLLEEYPDLYENYLAEPEPNRRKTLEDYFIKYLEREKPELLKSVSSEGARLPRTRPINVLTETLSKRSELRPQRTAMQRIRAKRVTDQAFAVGKVSSHNTGASCPASGRYAYSSDHIADLPFAKSRSGRTPDRTGKLGHSLMKQLSQPGSRTQNRFPYTPAFLSHSLATVANL